MRPPLLSVTLTHPLPSPLRHQPATPSDAVLTILRRLCLGLLLPLFTTSAFSAADKKSPDAPLRIEGSEQSTLDPVRQDGGLLPVAGVKNFGVLRASLAAPASAEGKGYTFNHHPDLAVWRGRFYVAWASGKKDEDHWPARELYSTSPDGATWSMPAELFPEGVSTPLRLYFFHAPSDRMLAFAGLRLDHQKTTEARKGPLVIREIRADHTFGPVFTLRPPETGPRLTDPAPYTTSTDAGFVTACRELLASHVTLETQDFGLLLPPAERLSWHNAPAWPKGEVGKNFWKAASFFHRRDHAVVGIGKEGWTSVSPDEGATWLLPVRSATLVTGTAKVWGQGTADGRYSLVYDPDPKRRYPLVVVTGDDGVTFSGMRVVQDHFATQRHPGESKNIGLQYIRGISEWASDGSLRAAREAQWIVYSANKEDIWVSRIPLGAPPTGTAAWSLYCPHWSNLQVDDDGTGLTFTTLEPADYAGATRLFPATTKTAVQFRLFVPAVLGASNPGQGAFDIQLLGGQGAPCPLHLRITATDLSVPGAPTQLASLHHPHPLTLRLEADCGQQTTAVFLDGQKLADLPFATRTDSLQRLTFHVWALAKGDQPNPLTPATTPVALELDRPTSPVTFQVFNFTQTTPP